MGAHRHAGSSGTPGLIVPVRVVHFLGGTAETMVTTSAERRILGEVRRAKALVIGAATRTSPRRGTHG